MNIVQMPNTTVPLSEGLRNLADKIDAGEYGPTDQATIIFPGAIEIFHLGGPSIEYGVSALFNCSCAITKITQKVTQGGGHE